MFLLLSFDFSFGPEICAKDPMPVKGIPEVFPGAARPNYAFTVIPSSAKTARVFL